MDPGLFLMVLLWLSLPLSIVPWNLPMNWCFQSCDTIRPYQARLSGFFLLLLFQIWELHEFSCPARNSVISPLALISAASKVGSASCGNCARKFQQTSALNVTTPGPRNPRFKIKAAIRKHLLTVEAAPLRTRASLFLPLMRHFDSKHFPTIRALWNFVVGSDKAMNISDSEDDAEVKPASKKAKSKRAPAKSKAPPKSKSRASAAPQAPRPDAEQKSTPAATVVAAASLVQDVRSASHAHTVANVTTRGTGAAARNLGWSSIKWP
ncbi:hypothetical protein DFH09DRAFT_1493260 [Mycena vulgaris]|nr:hypothetical protein DFH09DRAFT_1493260 [Mycena vulgaris]